MAWTRKDIPDLTGRTAVVTGANSGLGYETTKALAAAGARVIMACRSLGKAKGAQAKLLEDLENDGFEPQISIEVVDLASLASVDEFVERFFEAHEHLDLLINNAGVMGTPPQLTEDGLEFQFACNHFGHFALTAGLLPLLNDTPGSRVVSVSSLAARSGSLTDHDPTTLDGYDPFSVYGATKLANQVFAVELDRRLRAAGSPTISVAAHPGLAGTNLFEGFHLPGPLAIGARIGSKLVTQPASVGALPQLRAACEPGVRGGSYFGPGFPGQAYGPPKEVQILSHAADVDTGRRLWELSIDLTGADPIGSLDPSN
jgi:NAD(P)-dependent dehydrogenase (short-subunit alcohol dehydrogenase family)